MRQLSNCFENPALNRADLLVQPTLSSMPLLRRDLSHALVTEDVGVQMLAFRVGSIASSPFGRPRLHYLTDLRVRCHADGQPCATVNPRSRTFDDVRLGFEFWR